MSSTIFRKRPIYNVATFLSCTTAASAVALGLIHPVPALAQAVQDPVVIGTGDRGAQNYANVGQSYTDGAYEQTGTPGGGANGWLVDLYSPMFLTQAAGVPNDLVSFIAAGGHGGDSGPSDSNHPGGNGGDAGTISFTVHGGLVGGYAPLMDNARAGNVVTLATSGGNAGKGSDAATTTGVGGDAGLAGSVGDINLSWQALENPNDPADPNIFTLLAVRQGTAISLSSGGGRGGDGGEASSYVGDVTGRAGADGQAGGQIRADFALKTAVNAGTGNWGNGIEALSIGGDGGNGGEGYADNGTGTGGKGGDSGDGGYIRLAQEGGRIEALGGLSFTLTQLDPDVLGPTKDKPLVNVFITGINYAIRAESIGGVGGTGGTGGGDSGASGAGGAAGTGGNIDIFLNGNGLGAGTVTDPKMAVHTAGDNTVGVYAVSVGGAGGGSSDSGGAFSKTGGSGGLGGDGGYVSVALGQIAPDPDNPYVLIFTEGDTSDAVVQLSVGGGGGYGGSVDGGNLGFAAFVGGKGGDGGNGGQIFFTNGSYADSGDGPVYQPADVIFTKGQNSYGVLAQSIGGGGGRGGDARRVTLGPSDSTEMSLIIGGSESNTGAGAGGGGGDGLGVHLTNFGQIQTAGDQSMAVVGQSIGGGGGSGGAATTFDVSSLVTQAFAIGGTGGNGGNGGSVDLSNMGKIVTQGANATAVFLQSIGGGGGYGGSASAGTLAINPPDVPTLTITSAIGGAGGKGGDGGNVRLATTHLIGTQGASAYGVFAQSIGGGGGSGGDASVMSQAYHQSKLTVNHAIGGSGGDGGDGANVSIGNSGFIQTYGFDSKAVYAQSVGGGGGNGGYGQTSQGAYEGGGSYSGEFTLAIGGSGGTGGEGGAVKVFNYIDANVAAEISENASLLPLGAGSILTSGNSAAGIFAQSIGGGGGNAGFAIGAGGGGQISVNIALGGNGGSGGSGNAVSVANGNGVIATFGANSAGIFAQSIGGGGGNGGSATTGGGPDPQYALPEFMADNMVTAMGKDPNTTVQQIFDTMWDWKDNVQGEFSNLQRLDEIYAAYQEANPGKEIQAATSELQVTDLSVDIGGGRAGKGGAAGDGGNVTVTNLGQIATFGPGSSAIFGQSVGGGGGTGGASTATTGSDQLGVSVIQSAFSIGGAGGKGGKGGDIDLQNMGANASIVTQGDLSHGMFGQSLGAGGGVGGISTSNAGFGAVLPVTLGADYATQGIGGTVALGNAGWITTRGDDAVGMLAQSIGGGGGYASVTGQSYDQDTKLAISETQLLADGSTLLKLTDPADNSVGGNVVINLYAGGVIHTAPGAPTSGTNSYGILAQSIGGGGGIFIVDPNNQASAAACGGPTGNGLFLSACDNPSVRNNDAGDVTVTTKAGSQITTVGDGAAAILAMSLGGGGAIVNGLNGIDLSPGGSGFESTVSDRAGAGIAGEVEVISAADITTFGDYAHGIVAMAGSAGSGLIGRADGSGRLFFGQTDASAIGCNLEAAYCKGLADIEIVGGAITVSGAHAYGAVAFSQGNRDNLATVNLQAGSAILATGNAAGAVNMLGSGGLALTSVGNWGTIDASASTAGIAITGTSYTVSNFGTIRGSIVGNAVIDGNQPIVSVANQPGAVLEAGAMLNLGSGALTNAGLLHIGNMGKVARTAVTGDLVQQTGGTLVLDADLRSGASDKLDVNGKVTLGGTVHINHTSVSNRPLQVLAAAGGLTLDPTLKQTDNSALFDFPVVASGNTLTLTAKAHIAGAASGLSQHQQAVAGHLQSLFDGGASMDDGFTALGRLSSDGEVAAGLDTLGGHALGAIGAFRYISSRAFVDTLDAGCERQDDRRSCLWARVELMDATQNPTSDALGYKAEAQAYQLGAQTEVGENLTLGTAAAFEHGKFRDHGETARVKGDTLQLGVSLAYRPGNWTIAGAIDGGYGWYDSRRTISLGGISDTAVAKPTAWQVGAHLLTAYELELGQSAQLRPFAELHAMHVKANAFTETGPSPFNLAVESQSNNAMTVATGLELAGRIALNGGAILKLFASAAIELNGGTDWTTSASIAGQSAAEPFSVRTAAPDILGRFEAGLELVTKGNLSVSASYKPQIGKDFHSNTATARLAWRF